MATVTSGVGYGLYILGKRYIYPLIAPPTPAQLEQDKAALTASFDRAFALLDQLASDTETLKASEEERTQKLDKSLEDVDAVMEEVKKGMKRRKTRTRY